MKKIILIINMIVLPLVASSQGRIAEIWTQPAIFTATDSVSWFFDVTGTALDGETEGIYMWTWFPSEPDAGNFNNSSDFAALHHVEGNIWRFDLVPADYYGVDAGTITAFYGLLKNDNGSKVTDAFAPDQVPPNDIKIYDLSTIRGTARIDYFPKQFTVDRPLSILVNAANTWSDCATSPVQGELAQADNVHMHSGVNNWAIQVQNNAENLEKTEMVHIGDSIYRIDLILNDYFDLPDNYPLEHINIVFGDDGWAHEGKDEDCADFAIAAPEIPEVVTPELLFFLQKISKKDLLIIKRTNNEAGVTALHYVITAGTTELSGDFEGTAAEMTAYIDLVTPLKDIQNLETINIVITDNNDRTITDIDISLSQLPN